MGVTATVAEIGAEAFTAADVLAGVATASEAVSSGAAIGDLVAAGAAQDLGGGVFMDTVTGGLLDASGAAIAPEAAVSSGLMSAQSAIDLGLTSATDLLSSGIPASDLVSSGVLQELGNGAYLDAASGNLLSSSGSVITGPAAEGLQAGQLSGMSVDQATGNIIQTMDDGSKIILDSTGAPISSVPAPNAPFDPSGLTNLVGQKVGQTVANKALNALLAPATQQLQKGGFKPVTPNTGTLPNTSKLANTGQTPGAQGLNALNLTPTLMKSNTGYTLGDTSIPQTAQVYNLPTATPSTPIAQTGAQSFNVGGEVHTPQFYSPGGYASTHVNGDGDGTSDSVPAMLADGEFVIPADVVSGLGNGSNKAGAHVLDKFLSIVREDKQSNGPHKLPPDSKGPLEYLAMASRQVKA